MSNSLLRKMIYELGIYADYSKPFSFGYRMYEERPLNLRCDSVSIARLDNLIEFSLSIAQNKVKITAEIEDKDYKETFQYTSLPAVVKLKEGDFVFDYTDTGRAHPYFRLNVKVHPLAALADDLTEDLLIEELSKSSNVIEFTTTDYKKQRSKDIFNTIVKYYNQQETAYARELGEKSLVFLNNRIEGLISDLSLVEKDIEAYKAKNGITHVEMDIQYYAEYMKELQVKLIEAEQQTHLVKMLDAFIKDTANRYNLAPMMPTTMSLPGQETDVSPLVTYNQALLERIRIITNSGVEDNPMVNTLNAQIDKLRENVYQMIDNAYKSIQLFVDDLKLREKQMYARMGEVPEQERVYVDYRRQQEILQGVYLILLQKREEIVLSIGQPVDKARLIDEAYTKPRPVAPRKLFAALGIILFTLVITIGWLFTKEQVRSLLEEYRRVKKES
jgi:uncharacterized protein involved in exopolysaccharide biosynthesis